MKNIYVSYDALGYIENMSDNALHFEQEHQSLKVEASIATDKRVRAYIKAPNNNSTVTEEIIPTDNVYSFVLDDAYMAKGTLYIGFELYDDCGYIERLEPLKVYVDSFVSLGTDKNDNVYTVTMTVGEVETVDAGMNAEVENAGNQKDMVLNFKIPRGVQGLKGDKGEKGDKGDTGEQGVQGIQGIQGIQGVPGNDGYTPVKGVDYFTDEDVEEIVAATEQRLSVDIEAALDSIIAMQNELTGGDA